MEITNEHGNQRSILSGRGKVNQESFWAKQVDQSHMILTIQCRGDLAKLKAEFLIDKYVSGYPITTTRTHPDRRQLGICGDDDKENAVCYKISHPDEYKHSRPVAKLLINGFGVCTGWLIGPNILITNGHCIKDDNGAINTYYIFDYESTVCDSDSVENSVTYEAVRVIKHNQIADYTLIEMAGNPSSKYGYLEVEKRLPSYGELIYIPQHPMGRDKKLGIFKGSGHRCHILTTGTAPFDPSCSYGAPYKDFTYACDTEGGSSGSPVLSVSSGKVIGLHHCGGKCDGSYALPFYHIYKEINNLVELKIESPRTSPTVFIGEIQSPTKVPAVLLPTKRDLAPSSSPRSNEDKCLLRINTGECKTLIARDFIPIQNCECANFCNGEFQNCCGTGEACIVTCFGDLVAGCSLESSPRPTLQPSINESSSGVTQPPFFSWYDETASQPNMKPDQLPSGGTIRPPFSFWDSGFMANTPEKGRFGQTLRRNSNSQRQKAPKRY